MSAAEPSKEENSTSQAENEDSASQAPTINVEIDPLYSTYGKKEGLLNLRGTGIGLGKKYDAFYVSIEEGLLFYFDKNYTPNNKDNEKEKIKNFPIDVVILKNMEIGNTKKSESGHKFTFSLSSNVDKKYRIDVSTDSEDDRIYWLQTIQTAINLATSTLSSMIIEAAMKCNTMVPCVMTETIEPLRDESKMEVEGIFRISGQKTAISSKMKEYDAGKKVDLKKADVHLLSGILKQYLRELKDPLVPFAQYQAWVDLAGKGLGEAFDVRLKELVEELPKPNKASLGYLMRFLKDVHKLGAKNKMEASNLAIVFGPTLLRKPENIKSAGLGDLNASNMICEQLIERSYDLFPDIDVTQKVLDPELCREKRRIPVSVTEYIEIEKAIQGHDETFDDCLVIRSYVKIARKTEEKIVVFGKNRIYFFARGGKLESDLPLLDLCEVTSPSKNSMKITSWGSKDSKAVSFSFRPIYFAGFDIDFAIQALRQEYDLNFYGITNRHRFKLKVDPEERLKEILDKVDIPEPKDCGGFVRAYKTMCDYYMTPPVEKITWDLSYLFYNNDVKSFNLSELIHKERYPNPEYRTLLAALRFNTWFKTFVADGQKLGAEGMSICAEMLKRNYTITKVVLKNVGASRDSFISMIECWKENEKFNVDHLDVSNNSIEDKGLQELANFYLVRTDTKGYQHYLTFLDISNNNSGKKGMSALLAALKENTRMVESLKKLNISGNKMDSESSRSLGWFLGRTGALVELKMSGSNPNFQYLCASLEKAATLKVLDISDNKVNPKQMQDVYGLCKRIPFLEDLKMCNLQVPPEVVIEVLKSAPNLTTFDISDTAIGDDGLIQLCQYLTSSNNKKLTSLFIDRIWTKRTRSRETAINSITNFLQRCGLKKLHLAGGKTSHLSDKDVLNVVFSLINNKQLIELDISGHQAGDTLPLALAKVLQHNKTLNTLYWDDNGTTANGLKVFKIGLERNLTLKKMPLPLRDMSNIIRSEGSGTEQILALANEIQNIVFDNALQFRERANTTTIIPEEASGSNQSKKSRSNRLAPSAVSDEEHSATSKGSKSSKKHRRKSSHRKKGSGSASGQERRGKDGSMGDEQFVQRASTLFGNLADMLEKEQGASEGVDEETENLRALVQTLAVDKEKEEEK